MGEARLAMLVSGTNAGALRGGDLLGHQLCVSCDWRLDMADGTFGYLLIEFGKYSRFVNRVDWEVCPVYLIHHVSSRGPLTADVLDRILTIPGSIGSKAAFTRSQDHVQHHHYDVKWSSVATR